MSYDLFLSREYFIFSCSHIVIGESFFEKLHGHNYTVQVNIVGQQSKDNMVVNFYDIKRIVQPVVDSLDHHLILPRYNKHLEIIETDKQVIIKVPRLDKEYEIPKEDVKILPIENTTVEELSRYFTELLIKEKEFNEKNIKSLKVSVCEDDGQGVTYIWEF
ncbi:MAG: 6-pyruvoyl trahydropterin synthase family protein [Candidatus Heimdallarchaeaceae archaeon]